MVLILSASSNPMILPHPKFCFPTSFHPIAYNQILSRVGCTLEDIPKIVRDNQHLKSEVIPTLQSKIVTLEDALTEIVEEREENQRSPSNSVVKEEAQFDGTPSHGVSSKTSDKRTMKDEGVQVSFHDDNVSAVGGVFVNKPSNI